MHSILKARNCKNAFNHMDCKSPIAERVFFYAQDQCHAESLTTESNCLHTVNRQKLYSLLIKLQMHLLQQGFSNIDDLKQLSL